MTLLAEPQKGVDNSVTLTFAETPRLSRNSTKKPKRRSIEPEGFAGRLIGYARVSTPEQDLAMQKSRLRDAGVHDDNLWFETVSGVKKKRPQRDLAMMDAREGDIFVVYKLDRLGRSFRELLEMVEGLEKRKVGFISLTEGFDTTKPAGKFMFHMLGAMAEFERGLIAERTRDGMAEAKADGRQVGAPLFMTQDRMDEAEVHFRDGGSVSDLAEEWGISRQTLYVRFPKAKIEKLRAIGGRGRKR